ncbi:MAG: phosphatase PAP2 family protein, partial [Bacteroidales bacterium]|nr:phosphatase PAP2 family protein [Bacteroidales bacterium]
FSRLYLAVHFPTDLLAGAVFGMLSAWAFYQLYIYISSRETAVYNINRYQYTKSLYKKRDICILLIILATILISLSMAAYYIY